jgi:FixJ family two-component response regulator
MEPLNNASSAVYVVDDDPLARDLLLAQLRAEGFSALAYESGRAFLEAIGPDARGCILLDFQMPEMSGQQLQSLLMSRGVAMSVVFLTGTGDVSTTAAVMKLGAVDVIEKPWRKEQLAQVVREALQLEQSRWEKRVRRSEIQRRVAELTPRELEVGELVVQGRSNKAIAAALDVSERTVEVHRARVMAKMRAEGLANLVVLWREALGDVSEAADAHQSP